MKTRGIHWGVVIASIAAAGAGCAPPEVTPVEHGEDGIAQYRYDEASLSHVSLADGVDAASFELPVVEAPAPFDRVAVLWESYEAGGGTNVEVAVDGGAWLPVTVDFQEFVPETGATLFAGHVDVAAGSTRLGAKLSLFREEEANSPQLRAVRLETFTLAEVAETGEPVDESEIVEDELHAYGQPDIVTRAEWGARAPKCNGASHTPYRMTFHHTVTTNGETGAAARARMRQMQALHQDSRGWCDIGYHFSIDAAGVIYRGRTTTLRTASHAYGQNTGNLGVSLMGTYMTVPAPAAQLGGLMDVFAWLADVYGIAPEGAKVRGHREWPGQSTSCPGDTVLPKKQLILDGIASRLANGTPPTPPPDETAIVVDNLATSFAASSSWWTSTSQSDRYASDYKVRSTAAISDTAEWRASLDARDYEVFVWYSQGANRASAAPYFVYHQGGATKKVVDQRANGGRWVSLGTYAFAAGTAPRVGLSCWTGSGQFVIADAVKFEPR